MNHYDKYKRNQQARSFYKSRAWQRCREAVLKRDNYLCQDCLLVYKKITQADTVHHIDELRDHPEKALDASNLVSLCNACHNKRHPEKGRGKSQDPPRRRRVRVYEEKPSPEIYNPPSLQNNGSTK
ncbi:HNH endonuclease [Bacillus haynesii]|uniref:HNH endonuclease n=1 Tax=Bacillus haynesii TaxID=1925021 RepID=UPI0022825DD6|nr:HNH endonuclease signature motif containing protein [Bacillus haynesii]MCY8609894.1 HNH endonuclease [Bacillus haynesii]MEC0752126.1 HNH endonuclease signature motif containing protein [Bacillus haynesii]